MLVMGVETSCDETAVSIVEKKKNLKNGKIINEIVLSQVNSHKPFGGVVPELSFREHIKYLDKITKNILKNTQIKLCQIDAFAATAGPGLLGGLLVGSNYVKAICLALKKPFYAINHLQAHILISRINKRIDFPFIVLLASGGHTQLLLVEDYNKFKIIGETLDDALGEAFDKTAKLLGLSYPGGPEIEKLANKYAGKSIFDFPRPLIKKKNLNFSFSGLKTAVRKVVTKDLSFTKKNKIAKSFQVAVFDCLHDRCSKTIDMFKDMYAIKYLLFSGGVASNNYIRKGLNKLCKSKNINFHVPNSDLCVDNATMIAWTGIERRINGDKGDSLDFQVKPRWPLTDI